MGCSKRSKTGWKRKAEDSGSSSSTGIEVSNVKRPRSPDPSPTRATQGPSTGNSAEGQGGQASPSAALSKGPAAPVENTDIVVESRSPVQSGNPASEPTSPADRAAADSSVSELEYIPAALSLIECEVLDRANPPMPSTALKLVSAATNYRTQQRSCLIFRTSSTKRSGGWPPAAPTTAGKVAAGLLALLTNQVRSQVGCWGPLCLASTC